MPHALTSSALIGIDAMPISVQIDSNPGLHAFTVVGLGDKAVQESVDRIEAAVKHSGFIAPRSKQKRFVVNLSPADVRKEGPGYDLPVALAYLAETRQITINRPDIVAIGELGLDGSLSHTNGILAATIMARDLGASAILVPSCNAPEALLVSGIEVLGAESLSEAVGMIATVSEVSGEAKPSVKRLAPGAKWHQLGANLTPLGAKWHQVGTKLTPPDTMKASDDTSSFAHIRGQYAAKRALIIGAAGGHNIMLNGPPGTGKTLLARAMSELMPPLTPAEALEVLKIHSAAGLLKNLQTTPDRPFYAPHHTASPASVIGGGSTIRPGQVSLAHRGVLFMDELPEFARNVLESLRQPLEDGVVTVARASGMLTLPAHFTLVAAMNPCPCGNAGNPNAYCTCTATAILKYTKRISGPLMDRIDIHIPVPRETITDTGAPDTDGLRRAREAVMRARQAQAERFRGTAFVTNGEIDHTTIDRFCTPTPKAASLLQRTVDHRGLSFRAYHKIRKVARTIADIDGSECIQEAHVAEALSLRETTAPASS